MYHIIIRESTNLVLTQVEFVALWCFLKDELWKITDPDKFDAIQEIINKLEKETHDE